MPYYNDKDLCLHYEMIGQGPALILLHGFFGSLKDWYEYGYVESLVARYTIILIDLHGHGESFKSIDSSSYDLDRVTNDIIRLIDSLDIDKFSVLGFSHGGRIGYRLSSFFPDRVSKLAILGSHPFSEDYSLIRELLPELRSGFSGWVESKWHTARLNANDIDALEAAALDMDDFSCELISSHMPILSVAGDGDDEIEMIRKSSDLLPDMELHILENMNHFESLLKSEKIIPILLNFL